MIIGNLKNPACILKLFPPLFQSSRIRSLLIVKQSLLNFQLIRYQGLIIASKTPPNQHRALFFNSKKWQQTKLEFFFNTIV